MGREWKLIIISVLEINIGIACGLIHKCLPALSCAGSYITQCRCRLARRYNRIRSPSIYIGLKAARLTIQLNLLNRIDRIRSTFPIASVLLLNLPNYTPSTSSDPSGFFIDTERLDCDYTFQSTSQNHKQGIRSEAIL